MEIKWFGHSCFLIKGEEATVITDPFEQALLPPANIITISHFHTHHSFAQGVGGSPKVIKGPGEYEVADVFIYGIATFHDAERGKKRGRNTAYVIELEGIRMCHLGDLGHIPSSGQVEELGSPDILFIPVGGVNTINATEAAETINLLEPKLVIPMHFSSKVINMELDPVERFLKEMGVKGISPEPELVVTKSSLPQEIRVVVLDHGD